MSSKPCITCREVKPLTDFWRQKERKDGRFGECKACARARNARWHHDNADTRIPQIVANVNRQRRAHPMRGILASAKCRARKAGMAFSITLDDVPVPTHCPVLGIEMASGMGTGRGHFAKDRAPSIDRIDNSRGYEPDNVVVVSYRANRLKSDATVEELEAVAAFYRSLKDARDREGEGGGADTEVSRLPSAMSEVLVTADQEEGSVSPRHVGPDRDQGLLPPLQLGSCVQR